MLPSRYMIIDERSSFPVKRRGRGRKIERGNEPAITLLPPDPYLIMEKPDFVRSPSPTVYRTVPPKSARNKEASSFVILGETINTPVQSRPGSPSGRISPFRGHGFKSPAATLPNSRAPSPRHSPKKARGKTVKTGDRPRIGKDIGLPPKSPMKSKPQKLSIRPTSSKKSEAEENTEENAQQSNKPDTSEKTQTDDTRELSKVTEQNQTQEEQQATVELVETKQEPSRLRITKPKVATPEKSKLAVSPKQKTKTEKPGKKTPISVVKKASKPPLPPKKIELKATLKNSEIAHNQDKKNTKDGVKEKADTTGNNNKNKEKVLENLEKAEDDVKEVKIEKEVEKTKPKVEEAKVPEESKQQEAKIEEKSEKQQERLVPCFQPDKCQIAPPTMASPTPIITPTISTPSTTPDLASSSTKNSESIAAAPTTVTPSTLSSVSSTVVLTGNLSRKEIESRSRSEESGVDEIREKETKNSSSPEKVSTQMVKAASKDSIKWSNKDDLSGEITSATKVVKAEPDMEVLSPNNLRDSPPRMPPPNMAWDEGRLPNGDVPSKTEPEGKFRRFVLTVWKFLSYLFCCRCVSSVKCCRKPNPSGLPKPSILSKLNCFAEKSFRSPFSCCAGCCQSKCCKGKKCCRRHPKPEKPQGKSGKCCAKVNWGCNGCRDRTKTQCANARYKLNSVCRGLFCLNLMCCQNFLRKFKICHKLRCCQKGGFCSCWNPNVKREAKKLSKKSSRTSNNSRDKDNLDVVLVEHTSLMKAAIPVLPSCLAVFCLVLNLFVPGFGTFVSGMLCLCFGKPRFSVKDTPKSRVGSFILNTIIGVAQLFTVIFCLVGWGWSIWWGVIMYKLSRRQKRLKLAEKNQKEAEGSNVNHNHVDVEQG